NRVISGVNGNLAQLCSDLGYSSQNIYLFAGAGNTAMTHLFMGVEAWEIIREPYIPCMNTPDTQPAHRLGLELNPRGLAFLFPNIGSYFGGDLLPGILHADLDQRETPALMVDVGTNAEIVVGSRDWLIACAGAAGPALEGGVSKMGMTAGPGVIDTVGLDPETRELVIHTIDDEPPIGICGSGMIDLAAALFLSGRMDIRGKFHPPACGPALVEEGLDGQGIPTLILVPGDESGTGRPITLTQVDLNSLTSSKAAMYTILEVIVQQTSGLAFEELDTFYVAGTFGSYSNPVSAISIGMLPDLDTSVFQVLGNSSLGGCIRMLTHADAFDRIMALREGITYVELNV
ncbi:MAG: ASKHA domain-containing protein, partial [Desulfobacterales bacterium]|nr:ASKHA domain-containing protein [Desulfobacterales bacterium]